MELYRENHRKTMGKIYENMGNFSINKWRFIAIATFDDRRVDLNMKNI